MSEVDVRGLLQYVPQFREKVFVVIIDVPSSLLAETMLDLVALQNIGVRLVIGSTCHDVDELLDRAAEVEMKYVYRTSEFRDEGDAEEVTRLLNRGQAVFVRFFGERYLSDQQIQLAYACQAAKLMVLFPNDDGMFHGATSAGDIYSFIKLEDKKEGRESDENVLISQRNLLLDGGEDILLRAAYACKLGIPRVHLLDGRVPAVLLSELFSNEGAGAMIYADSYRMIRPLKEEDIVELLGMIARSVRGSRLVPRGYSEIEKNLEDYFVMDIDGNVVGCVALLRYDEENTGEVACLYVKQAHEGMGYGAELVRYAENQARDLGYKSIFALTNRAAHFFQDQMGYRELKGEDIPVARYKQLIESGRGSRVFGKDF